MRVPECAGCRYVAKAIKSAVHMSTNPSPVGPATGEPSNERSFLAPLHGLRGLMAAWVVSYHVSPGGLGAFRLTSYGYLAVDVFFIMSGFVLARAHGADFRRLRWAAIGQFLRLRWWRTYPLYAASLLLSLAAFALLRGQEPPPLRLLASLLLLEVWAAPGIGMNTPVWSLGVEWLGYLAFPVIAWACIRLTSSRAVAGAVLALAAEIAGLGAFGSGLNVNSGLGAITRMACGFMAGCMLGAIRQPAATLGWRGDLALILVGAAGAGVLLVAPDLWCAPLLFATVWLVARGGSTTSALLAGRLPLFLGRISFALYLCHWPILKVVQAWQPPGSRLVGLAGSLVAVSLSVGLAYGLCRLVEEPLRRFGRRPL